MSVFPLRACLLDDDLVGPLRSAHSARPEPWPYRLGCGGLGCALAARLLHAPYEDKQPGKGPTGLPCSRGRCPITNSQAGTGPKEALLALTNSQGWDPRTDKDFHAHACLYINGCENGNCCLVLVAFDVCEVALYHRMSDLLCLVNGSVCLCSVRKLCTSSCMACVSVHALLLIKVCGSSPFVIEPVESFS